MTGPNDLLECVPNFSEGRHTYTIDLIARAIQSVPGVQLLHVDRGFDAHRTVMTFAGPAEAVVEAAFRAIRIAAERIDMRRHEGTHPRMGATDVCPLIPLGDLQMADAVSWAQFLGQRVGQELHIPVYLYEHAATRPQCRNLSDIRRGEYEGLRQKMADPQWFPDFGPSEFPEQTGATVIGARDFLLAYNINLNTPLVARANQIASRVRESGRRVRQPDGTWQQLAGRCPGTKAIGWYLDEYGTTQVSMNLTDRHQTGLAKAFQACVEEAQALGIRVTGSELIGMVPLDAMLEAGRYFLRKQNRSTALPESEIIDTALRSLGLQEFGAFDPNKRILEYALQPADKDRLTDLSLRQFVDRVARDLPTPGGGSTAAAVGALGAALAAMVTNISSGKQNHDYTACVAVAEKAIDLQNQLLALSDTDSLVYERILTAQRLPRQTAAQQEAREKQIQQELYEATNIPLRIMQACQQAMHLCQQAISLGLPSTIPDAGAGLTLAAGALRAAAMSVRANLPFIKDADWVRKARQQMEIQMDLARSLEAEAWADLSEKLDN